MNFILINRLDLAYNTNVTSQIGIRFGILTHFKRSSRSFGECIMLSPLTKTSQKDSMLSPKDAHDVELTQNLLNTFFFLWHRPCGELLVSVTPQTLMDFVLWLHGGQKSTRILLILVPFQVQALSLGCVGAYENLGTIGFFHGVKDNPCKLWTSTVSKLSDWSLPPPDVIKINCDAAFFSDSHTVDITTIARNCHSDVIDGIKAQIRSLNAFLVETFVIRLGSHLIHRSGWNRVFIESVCLGVVQVLKGNLKCSWDAISVVDGIFNQITSFGSIFLAMLLDLGTSQQTGQLKNLIQKPAYYYLSSLSYLVILKIFGKKKI